MFGEGREGNDLRLVKPNCSLRQISPDTKMAGSLVKAGNRGIIPLPPSTPGVLDTPAPQSPPMKLLEGVGPAGEEGRKGARATQNSHCSWDPCRLEEQVRGPGTAQASRRKAASR